jgi:acetyl esterase
VRRLGRRQPERGRDADGARPGGPAISFAALIYPGVDLTDDGGSMKENAKGYMLEDESITWFMNHYIAEHQLTDPLASPALHASLAGLPPTFITTCEFDPLRDQGEAYGAALRAAGVPAEVKRYDGMIHGVANMSGVIDGGREMVTDVADRLRAALH